MKYKFLIWAAALLPFVLTAQEEIPAGAISYAPTAEENALLWKITGNALATPSYLFGTIHMIGKEDFHLNEATKEALANSDQVFFEIDTEEMFNMSVQLSLLMKSFMDDGMRLRDLLDEDEYKIVENHFNEIGLPLMLLERVKPMILSVFASEDLGAGTLGGSDMKSYELELTEIAKVQKKEINGLETIEYQMSMFDSIPYKAQAEMLVEAIKAAEGSDDEFAKMVELYKNQDLYGMQQMVASDKEGIGKYDRVLLINRNRNWIPLMAAAMKEHPVFFAVGAGHLGGEEGVIALLRRQGYTLEPVRN